MYLHSESSQLISQSFPTCHYSYSLTPVSHNSVYKSFWLSPSILTHLHLQNMIYSNLEKFKSARRWKLSEIAPCYSLFRGCTGVWQHKKTLPGKIRSQLLTVNVFRHIQAVARAWQGRLSLSYKSFQNFSWCSSLHQKENWKEISELFTDHEQKKTKTPQTTKTKQSKIKTGTDKNNFEIFDLDFSFLFNVFLLLQFKF